MTEAESETDRDSPNLSVRKEETSINENESSTNKTREVRTKVRRTRKSEKFKVSESGKTSTEGESVDSYAAPTLLETCNPIFSEDSETHQEIEQDRIKALLKAYSKKIKCRRIQKGGSSEILTKGSNRNTKFVANSGTGVPIVPKEIASSIT